MAVASPARAIEARIVDTPAICLLGSSLLIGSAGVATGVSGIALPSGRRLEVLLAPVVGAGLGIAVLGTEVALDVATRGGTDPSVAFLIAASFGWMGTGTGLVAIVARDRRERETRAAPRSPSSSSPTSP